MELTFAMPLVFNESLATGEHYAGIIVGKDGAGHYPSTSDRRERMTNREVMQMAPEVPAGWKLVPIEPTEAMLRNWPDSYSDYNRYKAFIEVAPEYKETLK